MKFPAQFSSMSLSGDDIMLAPNRSVSLFTILSFEHPHIEHFKLFGQFSNVHTFNQNNIVSFAIKVALSSRCDISHVADYSVSHWRCTFATRTDVTPYKCEHTYRTWPFVGRITFVINRTDAIASCAQICSRTWQTAWPQRAGSVIGYFSVRIFYAKRIDLLLYMSWWFWFWFPFDCALATATAFRRICECAFRTAPFAGRRFLIIWRSACCQIGLR